MSQDFLIFSGQMYLFIYLFIYLFVSIVYKRNIYFFVIFLTISKTANKNCVGSNAIKIRYSLTYGKNLSFHESYFVVLFIF